MPDYVNHNPDILTCLANLSNDEVFTPPELANQVLDLIPEDFWKDPNVKVLDPACKSGVFLRECAKRFLTGLEPVIPDLQERIDHIFQKQLFGYAITELTAYMSRRSVYCSKSADGKYSVTHFERDWGNINYKRAEHHWKGKSCSCCGAPKKGYSRGKDRENYAYRFIHMNEKKIQELKNMKFDLIISNPPYHLDDGGNGASASPLYHYFVQQAMKLNPRYLTMIIPARWYVGGKGLDSFRDKMLEDKHISVLHDFPNTGDCFPGVNIRGGVCYFLWNRFYDNSKDEVKVFTHCEDSIIETERSLKIGDLDIFLRYNQSISILNKVSDKANGNVLSKYVSARKPFGLNTNFPKSKDFKKNRNDMENPIPCYAKGKQIGYVELNLILMHREWINKWKLFTSRANNIGTELNDDNLNTFIGFQEICTETYVVIGADLGLSEESAKNLQKYLETKFARFCHSLAKASQDATAKTYRFVPLQDFSISSDINWTLSIEEIDRQLYKKYLLEDDEIAFIESMIKPMDLEDADE